MGALECMRARPSKLRRLRVLPLNRHAMVSPRTASIVVVHLIDGTYELFRHFYGLRRFTKGEDPPFGAVDRRAADRAADDRDRARRMSASRPITSSSRSATSSGPATRPARASSRRCSRSSIRSRKRSPRWASSSGRWSSSRRTTRWPPRRASPPRTRASRRSASGRPTRIWRSASATTRRAGGPPGASRFATPTACAQKFGVEPALIPDYLALVGDAADGYPGIAGHRRGRRRRGCSTGTARSRTFPPEVLGERRELALLFKQLATLRTDAPLFADVDELRWRGPTDAFAAWTERMGAAAGRARPQGLAGPRGSAAHLGVEAQAVLVRS